MRRSTGIHLIRTNRRNLLLIHNSPSHLLLLKRNYAPPTHESFLRPLVRLDEVPVLVAVMTHASMFEPEPSRRRYRRRFGFLGLLVGGLLLSIGERMRTNKYGV